MQIRKQKKKLPKPIIANINDEKYIRYNLELTKEIQNDYPYLTIISFLFFFLL